MTAFGYVAETYTSLYAGSYEAQTVIDRFTGPYCVELLGRGVLQFRADAIVVVAQDPRRAGARCS